MGVFSVRKELTGKKIGELTIEYAIENSKPLKWQCKCSCGNSIQIRATSLNMGETKSCGCYRKKILKELHWQGHGQISKTYYSALKYGAKDRNIEFSISIEYIWSLYNNQNGLCALSGLPIEFISGKNSLSTASLDRIDSKLGYTEGNVQWVHKEVNFMKQELDENRFIFLCNAISSNNKESKT
jgi:hypothetical protein